MLFFVYSFFGWVMEVIFKYIQFGKVVNRGFLIGPICPIYGFGGVFLEIFVSKYKKNLIIVFLLSLFFCPCSGIKC